MRGRSTTKPLIRHYTSKGWPQKREGGVDKDRIDWSLSFFLDVTKYPGQVVLGVIITLVGLTGLGFWVWLRVFFRTTKSRNIETLHGKDVVKKDPDALW